MTPVETTGLTVLISGGAGIVGKIMWDWLKGERNRYDPAHPGRKCVDHESCIVSLSNITREQESQRCRLQRGDERMDRIEGALGEIRTGVAVIVERITNSAKT